MPARRRRGNVGEPSMPSRRRRRELRGRAAHQSLEWLRQHGPVLEISTGPHGDGRFGTVGELVGHMFSAEKRYVERLSGRPMTDTATIPGNDCEALFAFGEQSRRELRDFIGTLPVEECRWAEAVAGE